MIISHGAVVAKQDNIALLRQELKNSKNDSIIARIKVELAWELKHISSKEAMQLADEALVYFLANSDHLNSTLAYRAKAISFVAMADFKKALSYFDSMQFFAEKANNYGLRAHCESLRGGLFGDRGDYDMAIYYYDKGLQLAEKSSDTVMLFKLNNNIADAYLLTNRNSNLVQRHLRLAIQYALSAKQWSSAAMSSSNLAKEFANNKKLDSMQYYISLTLQYIDKDPTERYNVAGVYHELANIYFNLGQLNTAKEYAATSLHIMDSIKRRENVLQPLTLLCKISLAEGNYEKANSYALDLLAKGKEVNGKLFIRDAYKVLSDIAKFNKDYDKALQYYERYKSYNDSVYSIEKEKSISSMETKSLIAQNEFEAKYKANAKDKENQLLSAKNRALSFQKWLAIALSAVMLFFGILFARAYNKKQIIFRLLLEEKKLVEQQAAEKLVLINEIHHRVKNNLTMLKSLLFLQARATKNEDAKKVLEESQNRIHSMALVHKNLYEDASSAQLNFPLFINNLFAELRQSYKANDKEITIKINGTCDDIGIEVATPLALILNELATNSFKYAFEHIEEGLIQVDITQQQNVVTIVYADNGPGLPQNFDLEQGGFGFKVIGILCQQINASITYHKSAQLSEFHISIIL